MTITDPNISAQLELRRRHQRHRSRDESVEERFNRFIKLQTASFELLRSSPEGYRNFLRRNHKSRRIEVIDGVWQPVSADRLACMASNATGRAKDRPDLKNMPEGD